MRFFTKECVQDKVIRQKLFYALRNDIYVEKFNNILKEYNLYEEYLEVSKDYYASIIKEWMIEHNITFS